MRTELQAQVEQKIGRNLLRYQLVELRLKEALPLRNVHLTNEGIDRLASEMAKTKKQSLGMLMPGFLAAFESMTPEDDQAFRSALESFVEKRNWLVHHLLAESNALSTNAACQASMDRLDSDYRASEDIAHRVKQLHEFVVNSLQAFLESWSTAQPGTAGVVEAAQRQAMQLAQRFGNNVSVELQLPLLQALDEIMAMIESTGASDDGWLPFAQVGHSMHRSYSGLPPRLLSMARQIGKYEFRERPPKPGAGKAWMYRRLPTSS
ncbi:MAG: hypothetical protein KF811_01595 [Dokdonella sp.]|nr:hypothetical protein [Dokdonella sp.]MCB1571159.1 hypothetical protein [Xanthomonadales bacterium]